MLQAIKRPLFVFCDWKTWKIITINTFFFRLRRFSSPPMRAAPRSGVKGFPKKPCFFGGSQEGGGPGRGLLLWFSVKKTFAYRDCIIVFYRFTTVYYAKRLFISLNHNSDFKQPLFYAASFHRPQGDPQTDVLPYGFKREVRESPIRPSNIVRTNRF